MSPPPLIALPPEAVPPTRAVPALEITVQSVSNGTQTEGSLGSSYWPSGIDYENVEIPDPAPRGTFLDSLDTLDFLGD